MWVFFRVVLRKITMLELIQNTPDEYWRSCMEEKIEAEPQKTYCFVSSQYEPFIYSWLLLWKRKINKRSYHMFNIKATHIFHHSAAYHRKNIYLDYFLKYHYFHKVNSVGKKWELLQKKMRNEIINLTIFDPLSSESRL